MAENLSITKSAVECVLECPLCLHQLTLPQTLQQCLHSYCKSCLDKVPQKTQDGHQGWLCPMCENFTKCDQIQQNTFIEELQKVHSELGHDGKIKCEQCLDECGEATWKCAECKIGLCESGKAVHLKIPMLKGHNILSLDSDGEKVIDNIVFCKVHAGIPAQLNCYDCEQLICSTCNTTDHQRHAVETVDQALERILPETESSVRQVDKNISITEAQIKGVKNEIEQTKESYAACRMQMDDHLEKVICKMRAMKAQLEEDVNEQESIALDTLKELKQQLENQLSQARILSNLTAVVTTKTRHTSQLQQLQTGLFEKIKAAGISKKKDLHFQLPEAKFIEGHQIKEELENIFGGLKFDLKCNKISISGEVCLDFDDNFLCFDLEEIANCHFTKSLEIDHEMVGCNRLSHIDSKLCLSGRMNTLIKIYNKDGNLEKTSDNGGIYITVVREAYNGNLICGSDTGLYKTNKYFTEWTMLAEGEFSDVVVHQRSFFALEYGSECVHQYSFTSNNRWKIICQHKLVTNKPKDFQLNNSSTLICSTDHFWVTTSGRKEIYKFSNTGRYLQMWKTATVKPAFCGLDRKGKALIAGFNGKFYLLDTNKEKDEIAIKEIWQSLTVNSEMDAVFDSNNDLWVLSAHEGMKLIKFTQNRPN